MFDVFSLFETVLQSSEKHQHVVGGSGMRCFMTCHNFREKKHDVVVRRTMFLEQCFVKVKRFLKVCGKNMLDVYRDPRGVTST